jgi:hypothetical protein
MLITKAIMQATRQSLQSQSKWTILSLDQSSSPQCHRSLLIQRKYIGESHKAKTTPTSGAKGREAESLDEITWKGESVRYAMKDPPNGLFELILAPTEDLLKRQLTKSVLPVARAMLSARTRRLVRAPSQGCAMPSARPIDKNCLRITAIANAVRRH